MYASQGGGRRNAHLLYRVSCLKCGKYNPKHKEWIDDPRTEVNEPIEWCECND
jgi:hypothetical protein